MVISSRTPEGLPSQCPLCGAETRVEYSDPAGDATCPNCGCLLWLSSAVLAALERRVNHLATAPIDASFVHDLGQDSLDMVELVMALEEEFDIHIPDDAAERIQSMEDVIRYLSDYYKQRRNEGTP